MNPSHATRSLGKIRAQTGKIRAQTGKIRARRSKTRPRIRRNKIVITGNRSDRETVVTAINDTLAHALRLWTTIQTFPNPYFRIIRSYRQSRRRRQNWLRTVQWIKTILLKQWPKRANIAGISIVTSVTQLPRIRPGSLRTNRKRMNILKSAIKNCKRSKE